METHHTLRNGSFAKITRRLFLASTVNGVNQLELDFERLFFIQINSLFCSNFFFLIKQFIGK